MMTVLADGFYLKTKVKDEKLNFSLPHVHKNKDTGEFSRMTFSVSTSIANRGKDKEDNKYRYVNFSVVCWDEREAKKLWGQYQKLQEKGEESIVFCGVLSVAGGDDYGFQAYYKSGGFYAVPPKPDESTDFASSPLQSTEQEIIDDDIPF